MLCVLVVVRLMTSGVSSFFFILVLFRNFHIQTHRESDYLNGCTVLAQLGQYGTKTVLNNY